MNGHEDAAGFAGGTADAPRPGPGRLRIAFVVLLAVFLLAATSAATGGGDGALARASGNERLAKRLAAQVTRADAARERYRALLDVTRALRLGVYNARGKAIVRGGERSRRDFYLHDFELKALASALGRRQRLDLETLALELETVGITVGGQPLPAVRLARILRVGVRRALRRPRRQASLGPLIVRALGLRAPRSYDLKRVLPPERLSFDPLAALVVMADAALPPHPRRTASSARAMASGSAPGRCPPIIRVEAFDMVGWQWPPPPGRLNQDPLHRLLLTFGLEVVDVQPGFKRTHYGPGGHAPNSGQVIDFEVAVRMTVDVPRVIRCSPLTGERIPQKGVVAGLPVRWIGEGTLIDHGFGSSVDRETKADGHARWHFVPRNETNPGAGDELVVPGTLTVQALASPSILNPAVWPPGMLLPEVKVSWPFEIRYHEEGPPRAWSGTVHGTTTGQGGITENWTADVTWNLTSESATSFYPGIRYRPTGSVQWTTSGSSLGCSHNGSGTMPIDPSEGTLELNADRTAYAGQGSLSDNDRYPVTVTCPDYSVQILGPHFGGTPGWFNTGTMSQSADPQVAIISGAYSFNNPANGTSGSYSWTFEAQP